MRTQLIVLSALALIYCAKNAAQAQCANRLTFSDYDRKLFVNAAYGQEAEVAAEFLASPSCDGSMLAALGKLGAKVRYSDSKVGYVLVALPKEKIPAADAEPMGSFLVWELP